MLTKVLSILIVEDYDVLRDAMVRALTRAGHRVLGVGMAEDIDELPMGCLPDLYIIDLNLPGENGLSLVRRIRASAPLTKIVVVTGRTAVVDKVAGYAAGADIYLPKPVAPEELEAIAKNLSERTLANEAASLNKLLLWTRKLTLEGPQQATLLLTPAEANVLGALALAPNQSLEHWQVAQHLGVDMEVSKDSQEVRIGRLRKKLLACGAGAPGIKAVRGYGYRLLCDIEVR